MLMVTHACNLNCSYCYEAHKSDKKMSLETAKKVILDEVEMVQGTPRFEEIEIDFMGGEPLTNFDLIKQIVEWLERMPMPMPYICFATTNGTLLTPPRKEWLRLHRNTIQLCLSYDGDSQMQQINRGALATTVDLPFFKEVWPEQKFHMTVSQETLSGLARAILDMQRLGYMMEVSLAQGVLWTKADAICFYNQLSSLSESF